VQVQLDRFYSFKEGLTYERSLRPTYVLFIAISLEHRPICSIVYFGQSKGDLTFFCFKLNISHLEVEDFCILVHSVRNIFPYVKLLNSFIRIFSRIQGKEVGLWDFSICETAKFI
jgi:hypothetical protein